MDTLGITVGGLRDFIRVRGGQPAFEGLTMADVAMADVAMDYAPPAPSLVSFVEGLPQGNDVVKPAQYTVWHAESDLFLDVIDALHVRFGLDVAVWCCLLGDPPVARLDRAVAVWQCWTKPCCPVCIKGTKTKRALRRENKALCLAVAMSQSDEARYLANDVEAGTFFREILRQDHSADLQHVPANKGDMTKALGSLAHTRVEMETEDGARPLWHFVVGMNSFQHGKWSDAALHFERARQLLQANCRDVIAWQLNFMTACVQIAQSTASTLAHDKLFFLASKNSPNVALVLDTMVLLAHVLVNETHLAAALRLGLVAMMWTRDRYDDQGFDVSEYLAQWVVNRLVYHSQLDQIQAWLDRNRSPSDKDEAVQAARLLCASQKIPTMEYIQDFEAIFTDYLVSDDFWHENNGTCVYCRGHIRGTRMASFKAPGDMNWGCYSCATMANAQFDHSVRIRPPARYYRECLVEMAARPAQSVVQALHRFHDEIAAYQEYCDLHLVPAQERMECRGIVGGTLAFFSHFVAIQGGRKAFQDLSVDQVCDRFIAPTTPTTGLSLADLWSQDESTTHLVGVASVFVSYDPTDKFLDVVDALHDHCARHATPTDTAFWFRCFSTHENGQPSFESTCNEAKAAIRSSASFLSVLTSWQHPSAVCNVQCFLETWFAADAGVPIALCVSDAQAAGFRDYVMESPFFQQIASNAAWIFQVVPDADCYDLAVCQLDSEEMTWLEAWVVQTWQTLDDTVNKALKTTVLATFAQCDNANGDGSLVHWYTTACLVGLDTAGLSQVMDLALDNLDHPIAWRSVFYAAIASANQNDSEWEMSFFFGLVMAKKHLSLLSAEYLQAEHALGTTYISVGQLQNGLNVLTKCLMGKVESLGKSDVSTLRTAEVLASLRIKLHDVDAIEDLRYLVSAYTQVLPQHHKIVRNLRLRVSAHWTDRAQYALAKAVALEAYEVQVVESTRAVDHVAIFECLGQLVVVLLRQGHYDQAQDYLNAWNTTPFFQDAVKLYWGLLHWGRGEIDRAAAMFDQYIQSRASAENVQLAVFSYYEMLVCGGHLTKPNIVWQVKNLFLEHTPFNEEWASSCHVCLDQVVGSRVVCTACPVQATTYCFKCFSSTSRIDLCAHSGTFQELLPPPRFLQQRQLELLCNASKEQEYDQVFDQYERYCVEHGLPAPTRIEDASAVVHSSSKLKQVIKEDPSIKFSIGLTLGYFKRFIDMHGGRHQFKGLSTRDVCKRFLLPFTSKSKLSLVEHVLNHDPDGVKYVKKASIFVSHSWDYLFLDVVDALDHYMHANGFDDDTAVWFCTFCNNQHLVNSDNPPPFEFWVGQFKGALAAIGNVVMVFDRWNHPGTLDRSWCVFEVWAAVTCGATFDVALSKTQTAVFAEDLNHSDTYFDAMNAIHCETSTTSVDQDREEIFAVIEKEIGFPALNETVRRVLQEWIVRAIQHRVDNSVGSAQTDWLGRKAMVCCEMGEFATGLEALEMAPSSLVRSNPNLLYYVARLKYELKHPRSEWGQDMLETIALCTNESGQDSNKFASMEDVLGGFYYQLDEFQLASVHLEKAWTIRKKTLYQTHPAALSSLRRLGISLCKIDNYDQGIPLLRKCYYMMSSVLDRKGKMECLGALLGFVMKSGRTDFVIEVKDLGWQFQLWLVRQDQNVVEISNAPSPHQWIDWLIDTNRSPVGKFTDDEDQAIAHRIAWDAAILYRSQGQLDKAMDVCTALLTASNPPRTHSCLKLMGYIQADLRQYNAAQILLEQALARQPGQTASDDDVLMSLFHVMVKCHHFNTIDAIDAFQELCDATELPPHRGWNGLRCSMCAKEIEGSRVVCTACPFEAASYCSNCVPSTEADIALPCSHTDLDVLAPPGTYLREKRLQVLAESGSWTEFADADSEYRTYCQMIGISPDHTAEMH